MIFTGTLDYYNECQNDDERELSPKFLIIADTFKEAQERLVSYVGEDNVIQITLRVISPDNMIMSYNNEKDDIIVALANAVEKDAIW